MRNPQVESVLYSFAGGTDGAYPEAGLTNVGGTLYGTTSGGGRSICQRRGKEFDCGTVFRITTSGTESVLYRFRGIHGSYSWAALTTVGTTLYGTTYYGGANGYGMFGGANGYGTVFKIRCAGTTCSEHVLYSFAGGSDGENPNAALTKVRGTLYGTTVDGGGSPNCAGGVAFGCGTVFQITTSGVESVLHSFADGSDGALPTAALTNVGGTLYGTTEYGGGSSNCTVFEQGCGTVFQITTSGVESVLYSFAGGSDGQYPYGSLTKVGGTLYGTTTYGGSSNCTLYYQGCGTVFQITASGTYSQLYSFAGGSDGAYPVAALTNVGGTLYGTTSGGGANGRGTVFQITTSGAESVLYSFAGGGDGQTPYASLLNVGGTLYGTTESGGANGDGTVFEITTSGAESALQRRRR